MIGRRGERGSEISVLTARHDDDDIYTCVCVFFSQAKPESGIIPSGQLNYSNFEHLNLPG